LVKALSLALLSIRKINVSKVWNDKLFSDKNRKLSGSQDFESWIVDFIHLRINFHLFAKNQFIASNNFI
jgi:hypothetical protein